MMECPSCLRLFPEVAGAPTQVCPHCGHEASSRGRGAASVASDPAGAARAAVQALRERYHVLLAMALPLLAYDLAAAFLDARLQAAFLPDGAGTTGQRMQYLGVALPLTFLGSTLQLAFWSVAGALVIDRLAGGARVRATLRRWPTLLGLGFVLTLVYVTGLLLLLVPFFVVAHWFLYAPAAVADGERTITGAFESSRRFARARRTHGFTALVVMLWLAILLAALLADAMLAPRLGAIGPALGPLLAWLTAPIVPAFPAAFWAVAARAPEVAPPAPGAPAAERFRTTKCPRCGTLIPYTATGSAVEVTCPTCGRAGRVL